MTTADSDLFTPRRCRLLVVFAWLLCVGCSSARKQTGAEQRADSGADAANGGRAGGVVDGGRDAGSRADAGDQAEPDAGHRDAGNAAGGAGAGGRNAGGSSAGGSRASGGAGGERAEMTCADLACPEHASCDDSGDKPRCRCDDGYELRGDACVATSTSPSPGDPCAANNGGCDANASCKVGAGGVECSCKPPFSGDGKTCARPDPCQTTPCEHAGRCSSQGNGDATCDCSGTGFEGTRCQSEINECASNPCRNGGTCADLVNDYRCTCAEGFEGRECETSTGCTYEGRRYARGEMWQASDGCNDCTCQPDATVSCTTRVCTVSCGGPSATPCASGSFCDYPASANCGADAAAGSCKPKPADCNNLPYAPQCGCDDVTYPNKCNAELQGVSVKSAGACAVDPGCDYDGKHYDIGDMFPAADGCNTCQCRAGGNVECSKVMCGPPKGCGGSTGNSCSPGQFCQYAPAAMCGRNNMTGTCSIKPEVCQDPVAAVCGCDNRTYQSSCAAAMAGVSIAMTGACISNMP